MTVWAWTLVAVCGGSLTLWLLDRLCLWLEARGWLFYRHRQPQGGATTVCLALQEIVEPSAREIIAVTDEQVAGRTDPAGAPPPRPRFGPQTGDSATPFRDLMISESPFRRQT